MQDQYSRTQLLLDAEALHIPCANGLWMLVAQAKESAEYFTGTSIDDAAIAEIHANLAAQMANIVLIGMPGCGKSTIGALLADKLSRKLVDADEEIFRLAGKSIPAIFAEDGEAVFRDWETKALSQLGKQSALVIATGGGVVESAENRRLLRESGVVALLDRDIRQIAGCVSNRERPLLKQYTLEQLARRRRDWYLDCADAAIGSGTAELIEGAEKLDALSALMRHMAGREDTFTEDQARGAAVLAIRVRSLSAKAKKH